MQCVTESEGGSYSEQAVSGLQPSVFLGSSSLDDLGDIDAVVPRDMLVADSSGDAEAEPWVDKRFGVYLRTPPQTSQSR